ncbi:MAG: efflux RND transporter permease subunit [Spirochaetota bacterium]
MKRCGMYTAGYFTLLSLLLLFVAYTPGIKPALYPALPQPHLLVETYWPQAGAEEIDRQISIPLLEAFSAVPGLQTTRTHSRCGRSSIYLKFSASGSTAAALRRVQRAAARASARLPPEAHFPHVSNRSQADLPVFAAAVPLEYTAEAERFRADLSALPEISLAESESATGADSLLLNYRYTAGQLYGFSSTDAAEYLRSRSFSGAVNGIDLLPAAELTGTDVDRVLDRPEGSTDRRHSIHRLNGERQHIFICYADFRSNRIGVCRRLRTLCNKNPAVREIYNHGRELERILRSTSLSVLCGIAAIALLLVVQMKRFNRETALLLSSLPLILCAALATAAACGVSMNIMSLAAIAVGSGLVVDAAVLFYEENCRIGAGAAVRTVRAPILMSNLTTLSIFIPVLLLPLSIRHNFRAFMLVMTVILTLGTVWTLAVFPRMCRPLRSSSLLQFSFHMRLLRTTALLHHLSCKRRLCWLMYALMCVLPLLCIPKVEFRTFPRLNRKTLHLQIEFPAGTRPGYIDSSLHSFFSQAQTLPQVQTLSVSCRAGEAAVTITCRDRSGSTGALTGLKQIPLPPGASLIEPSRSALQQPFIVRLYASHPTQLRPHLTNVAARIQAARPAYRVYYHFKDAAARYHVSFDVNRCAHFDIPPAEAAAQIHRILTSAPAAKLGVDRQADILLQPQPYPSDFAEFYRSFRIVEGRRSLPLLSVSSLSAETGTGDLQRINGALYSGLTIFPGRTRTSDAARQVERMLRSYPLPADCSFEIAPVIRRERGRMNWVLAAIALAAILLTLLLYSYFGRVEYTLFVLSYIPAALALPLPVLICLDIPLSLPVLTGFLVNVGLSVNNALVLISQNKRQRLAAADLPRQLCLKLPSLSASTVTTAAGVIPLLFGSGGAGGVLSGLSVVIAIGAGSSWAMIFLSTALVSGPSAHRSLPAPRQVNRSYRSYRLTSG